MKYIIVRGRKDAGKSTTCSQVITRLNHDSVKVLHLANEKLEDFKSINTFNNGVYVLWLDKKLVLVVSGAPTELRVTITQVLIICEKLDLVIDICIVSMRTHERRLGFDTRNQIKEYGELLDEFFVAPDTFENLKDDKRIDKIIQLVIDNI
jgi:nucleoside-triphosphatase THEP1